jgi:hypothetical protein
MVNGQLKTDNCYCVQANLSNNYSFSIDN